MTATINAIVRVLIHMCTLCRDIRFELDFFRNKKKSVQNARILFNVIGIIKYTPQQITGGWMMSSCASIGSRTRVERNEKGRLNIEAISSSSIRWWKRRPEFGWGAGGHSEICSFGPYKTGDQGQSFPSSQPNADTPRSKKKSTVLTIYCTCKNGATQLKK